MKFRDFVADEICASAALLNKLVDKECFDPILSLIEESVATVRSGGKILIFGNGGSAADAQHFAGELVGKFRKDRLPLPVIALTTDTSIITAVGNDYGYEDIFARQVTALCNHNDIVIGLSTSGKSPNVRKAFAAAMNCEARTAVLCGKFTAELYKGLKSLCDIHIYIPSDVSSHIQQAHEVILHTLAAVLESAMEGKSTVWNASF